MGAKETRQTGEAVENALRIAFAANRDSKLLFDADGQLERIDGVATEASANERQVVGNRTRIGDIGPEQCGGQTL
jgi:hypothetical protein